MCSSGKSCDCKAGKLKRGDGIVAEVDAGRTTHTNSIRRQAAPVSVIVDTLDVSQMGSYFVGCGVEGRAVEKNETTRGSEGLVSSRLRNSELGNHESHRLHRNLLHLTTSLLSHLSLAFASPWSIEETSLALVPQAKDGVRHAPWRFVRISQDEAASPCDDGTLDCHLLHRHIWSLRNTPFLPAGQND